MMLGKNTCVSRVLKRIKPGSTGLEIGVWKGDTSQRFLDAGAAELYLVDTWSVEPYRGGGEHGSWEAYLKRYRQVVGSKHPEEFDAFYDRLFAEVCKRFKGKPVTVVRGDSVEFFKFIGPAVMDIDWVYIDGDHSYEGVMKDLQSCLANLRPGATIYGDDFQSQSKPGVTKAVKEFCRQHDLHCRALGGYQYEIQLPGV